MTVVKRWNRVAPEPVTKQIDCITEAEKHGLGLVGLVPHVRWLRPACMAGTPASAVEGYLRDTSHVDAIIGKIICPLEEEESERPC
jgi:hypothetical protein